MRIKTNYNSKLSVRLKNLYLQLRYGALTKWIFTKIWAPIKTKYNVAKNSKKQNRKLEIGTDPRNLIDDFETLSIHEFVNIDYVLDISKGMPFQNNSFDIIYASHVLEHIPWYKSEDVLKEIHRILKPGGQLEIWVPDGLKIAKALIAFEENQSDHSKLDGYYECVKNKDPRLWASLRIYAHGDGTGNLDNPNWHHALFTPSLLINLFESAGFKDVCRMGSGQERGWSHGWINLGVIGKK